MKCEHQLHLSSQKYKEDKSNVRGRQSASAASIHHVILLSERWYRPKREMMILLFCHYFRMSGLTLEERGI